VKTTGNSQYLQTRRELLESCVFSDRLSGYGRSKHEGKKSELSHLVIVTAIRSLKESAVRGAIFLRDLPGLRTPH